MQTEAAILDELGQDPPYRGSRPLTVETVELADPGPGELLVAIDAVGLCHSDLSVVDATRPRPTPMALGHEATGVVAEVGAHVTDVAVGDRVILVFVPSCGLCGHCTAGAPARCPRAATANTEGTLLGGGRRISRRGEPIHHHLGVSGFARHAVVDRRSAVRVADDLPAQVAALFGCAVLTGVGAAVNSAKLRPGESAAVVGLGGVGLAAVLGAVLANAYPVVAVDPVPAKRELAVALGATAAVAPDDETAIADLLGAGADVAIEAAGRTAALQTAWSLTGPGGRTVTVGLPHPSERLSISPVELVGQGRTLIGSYLGDSVPQRDVPRYIALWRAGRLPVDRLHTDTRPLADINAALDDLAAGTAVRQVLTP